MMPNSRAVESTEVNIITYGNKLWKSVFLSNIKEAVLLDQSYTKHQQESLEGTEVPRFK